MERRIVEFPGITDSVFKTIMKNKSILKAYINIICDLNITEEDIEYEPDELRATAKLKGVIFDIRLKVQNTRIELEAQNNYIIGTTKDNETYHDRRKIHYASMLHAASYNKGETYNIDYKTISIIFLNHKLEGDDYIQHTKFVNLSTNKVHDVIDIIEIGLKNIKSSDTIKSKMLKLLIDNDLTKYSESNDVTKEVADMIFEFNADERRKRIERMELVNEIPLNTLKVAGKREGLEQGLQQGLELTAKRMKEAKVDIDIIIQVTGLTKEQIELL